MDRGDYTSVTSDESYTEDLYSTDINKVNLTLINTNARSLCPKISSLVDCLADMEAAVGVVTETWLSDGDTLSEDLENLARGTGLRMICKNRKANDLGYSHGGIAIIFRESMISLKRVKLHDPHNLEVIMAVGTIKGGPERWP